MKRRKSHAHCAAIVQFLTCHFTLVAFRGSQDSDVGEIPAIWAVMSNRNRFVTFELERFAPTTPYNICKIYCPKIRHAVPPRQKLLQENSLIKLIFRSNWSCNLVYCKRHPAFSCKKTTNVWIDDRQITHLICARLMTCLGGVFGPLIQEKEQEAGPKTPLKKSYRSYFRRAQIRWVIWQSSNSYYLKELSCSDFGEHDTMRGRVLQTPRPATGVSRALRARSVPGSVPESVPQKRGVSDRVSDGVSLGPFGPQRHPVGHSVGHSPFLGDTLGDTPRDTSGPTGPKGPRDSCSWPGSSQVVWHKHASNKGNATDVAYEPRKYDIWICCPLPPWGLLFRTRSTITRDRNLQFRGTVSTGFFLICSSGLYLHNLQVFCANQSEIGPKTWRKLPDFWLEKNA